LVSRRAGQYSIVSNVSKGILGTALKGGVMQNLHFFMKPRRAPHDLLGIESLSINLKTLLESHKSRVRVNLDRAVRSVSPEHTMSQCGRAWIKFSQVKKLG
jgi:hypothetical protein